MSDALALAVERGAPRREELAPMILALEALKHLDSVMQAVFWLSPNSALAGDLPIARILADPDAVVRSAQMFGEQGSV